MTPKRQRDATLQSQKDNLRQMEAQEEQRLVRGQREYLELEIRKFRRKKILNYENLETELLREVTKYRDKKLYSWQLITDLLNMSFFGRN